MNGRFVVVLLAAEPGAQSTVVKKEAEPVVLMSTSMGDDPADQAKRRSAPEFRRVC
jgi:hypothetical protein